MKALKSKSVAYKLLSLAPMLVVTATLLFAGLAYNANSHSGGETYLNQPKLISRVCGGGVVSQTVYSGTTKKVSITQQSIKTSIDFGCDSKGNPIVDLIFAIIRFLSAGVGLVVIASVIVGGIQYILSRGDPQATQKAVGRLVTTVIALIIYIFAYAILNYVIPGGFFN